MADGARSADPFQMWRDWLGRTERQLNESLTQLMSRQEVNEQAGKLMEAFIAHQAAVNEAQQTYLSLANVPSRQDVLGLAERMGAMEERLGRIEALLERIAPAAGERIRPVARARVKRTKKPPAPAPEAGE